MSREEIYLALEEGKVVYCNTLRRIVKLNEHGDLNILPNEWSDCFTREFGVRV